MQKGKQERLREKNGNTEKYCPHCNKWKDRKVAFSPKKGVTATGKSKVHSWCKECCVQDVAIWRAKKGGAATPLTARIQQITRNIIEAGGEVRSADIRELYAKQDGKCYYTGIQMELMTNLKNDPRIMSCDRKDSKKGYTKDNVVLCCLGINHLKGRHSIEYMYENLKLFAEGAKKLRGWD